MRVLAAVGLMVVLSGCAALPSGRENAAVAAPVFAEATPQATPRKPRASQQELLAAYWAERRASRPVFVTFDPGPSAVPQDFSSTADADEAWRDYLRRSARESLATRDAVNAALRR